MDVLHIASEVTPFSKTGGLADVVSALPRALVQAGVGRVMVVSPLYPSVLTALAERGLVLHDSGVRVGWDQNRVMETTWQGVRWVFLSYPGVFDRAGLYEDPNNGEYPDNSWRFAWLCRAALQAAPKLLWNAPDLVHAHDWQAALVPYVVRQELGWHQTAVVQTVHNLAYQGRIGLWQAESLGIHSDFLHMDCFEHHGDLNLLKGGLAMADAVTTVSPTYAQEITHPEHGCELEGLLLHRVQRLTGILNGLDTDSWDPANDPAIQAPYSAKDPAPKEICKQALLQEFSLNPHTAEPLVAVIGRMADQKGLDLVAEIVPKLSELGAHMVVLGSGDRALEARFRWLAEQFSDHLRVHIGFSDALARRIVAGSDITLVPSRFEPCGLVQLQAMRYGSIPVARATGGLCDTIEHGVTGFLFQHSDAQALAWALDQAIQTYRSQPTKWAAMRLAGMARDWGWRAPAQETLALYRELVAARR
jgi:starch synthase